MATRDRAVGVTAELDLTDPRTFVQCDMPEVWRRLRRDAPLYWHPQTGARPGFWVVTRYDDALSIYRDSDRFSSERGNVLATLLAGGDSAAGHMLAVTDGDRHRRVRTALLKSFRPRTLDRVAEQVRNRARALVQRVTTGERFDFAAEVAEHIPMGTICDLMAVPEEDRRQLLGWNKQALSADIPGTAEADAVLARNEILLYFTDLVQQRRQRPGEDVISALTDSGIDPPLTEEEIVFNCYSLVIGGDESSRMSSIGTVLELSRHPDQWLAWKNGEVAADSAVEEVLRWTTPAMHLGRRAVQAVTIRNSVVNAGDIVTVWNSSANRDDAVFDDPESFRLGRNPNRHLAFGYGSHFCVGAYLGRLELRVLLETLRDQVREIELAGAPARVYSNFLYGYSTLPVRFH